MSEAAHPPNFPLPFGAHQRKDLLSPFRELLRMSAEFVLADLKMQERNKMFQAG